MLLKKKSKDRVRRKNVGIINRYTSENFQVKKEKSKTIIKRKKNEFTNEMSQCAIKRQLIKRLYTLATNGDYTEANKVEMEEHNRTKKI